MTYQENSCDDILVIQKVNYKKSDRIKALLIKELPKCFKEGELKQPLCIGIHLQVHTHYKDEDRFEPDHLQKGLNKYCAGEKYLKVIVEGAHRIDIEGHPVGVVTAKEAVYAKEKLKKIEELRKKKEIEKAKTNLKHEENKIAPQSSRPTQIIKHSSIEELRKKRLLNQVNEKPIISKEQIKKEKQAKYAKKMARKKLRN